MARKAPVFHSEFKERMVLTIRAPEGESQRAVALRRLVDELNERYATGHLTEFLVEALLEKQARESLIVESAAQVVKLTDGLGSKSDVGKIEPAETRRGQELVEGDNAGKGSTTPVFPTASQERKVMAVGLRVMG